MIERADAIAIITISEVKEVDIKGKMFTYRQAGNAKVDKVLKGELPKDFILYGAETFICARCIITNGRFLAFLKKDDALWTGANWQLSLRPIKDDEVEWYTAEDNRFEMKPLSLQKVISEIKSIMAKSEVPAVARD
ncbi:MAG: hypothetical protein ABI615_06675 [Chthoniobacterales bacterium]